MLRHWTVMLPSCVALQHVQNRLGPCSVGTRSYSLLSALLGGSKTGPTQVCCIDPRVVLQRKERQGLSKVEELKDEEACVTLEVPPQLLAQLSKGKTELGDADDPSNHWVFGEQAEIFEYHLIGTHATKSGYTSIIRQQDLEDILRGDKASVAALPSWDDFRTILSQSNVKWPNRRSPFLFAGYLVDSLQAAVYKLDKGKDTVGLLISSESAADEDDD